MALSSMCSLKSLLKLSGLGSFSTASQRNGILFITSLTCFSSGFSDVLISSMALRIGDFVNDW